MRYFVLYDGIVVTGKAAGPRYLLVDRDNVEIKNAAHLYGKAVLEAHDALSDEHGDKNISILQCGITGEKLVRFACLIGDFNHAAGRGGMGVVFGSKNLPQRMIPSPSAFLKGFLMDFAKG